MQMDDYRRDLAQAEDWESLAHGLANLNDFKTNLIVLIQSIEKDIYEIMPDKKNVVEGVGTVEKRRSSTKKWDSVGLLHKIINDHIDSNGELQAFDLVDTLKKVMPITPSLGWRSTALAELNIDTTDYCDVTWGRQTISIQ